MQERPASNCFAAISATDSWQYNQVFALPGLWLDVAAFDNRTRGKELYRMAQDFGLTKAELLKQSGKPPEFQPEQAVRFDRVCSIGFP